jgi:hypothetical protein
MGIPFASLVLGNFEENAKIYFPFNFHIFIVPF